MNVLWTMMEKDKATVSGSATNAPVPGNAGQDHE
jgi:hypothetical protein